MTAHLGDFRVPEILIRLTTYLNAQSLCRMEVVPKAWRDLLRIEAKQAFGCWAILVASRTPLGTLPPLLEDERTWNDAYRKYHLWANAWKRGQSGHNGNDEDVISWSNPEDDETVHPTVMTGLPPLPIDGPRGIWHRHILWVGNSDIVNTMNVDHEVSNEWGCAGEMHLVKDRAFMSLWGETTHELHLVDLQDGSIIYSMTSPPAHWNVSSESIRASWYIASTMQASVNNVTRAYDPYKKNEFIEWNGFEEEHIVTVCGNFALVRGLGENARKIKLWYLQQDAWNTMTPVLLWMKELPFDTSEVYLNEQVVVCVMIVYDGQAAGQSVVDWHRGGIYKLVIMRTDTGEASQTAKSLCFPFSSPGAIRDCYWSIITITRYQAILTDNSKISCVVDLRTGELIYKFDQWNGLLHLQPTNEFPMVDEIHLSQDETSLISVSECNELIVTSPQICAGRISTRRYQLAVPLADPRRIGYWVVYEDCLRDDNDREVERRRNVMWCKLPLKGILTDDGHVDHYERDDAP